jgi:hypothetical protein
MARSRIKEMNAASNLYIAVEMPSGLALPQYFSIDGAFFGGSSQIQIVP